MNEVAHNLSKKQEVTERWLPVVGFEGLYEVSDSGNVRWVKNGNCRFLRPRISRGNYYSVILSRYPKIFSRTVHRLVADAFIPNPLSRPEIDHIDADRLNNHVSNLRWVTHQENMAHAGELGHMSRQHHGKRRTSLRGVKRTGRIRCKKQEIIMANNNIESKTFKEIWTDLNGDEKNELARRLYLARCCSTYQTLWNWGTGKVRPSSPLVRDKVASTISKIFGVRVSASSLFPRS